MGMDYSYSGSASYNRFNEELCKVAKVFGGTETNDSSNQKYVFPNGTDEILIKWFNNIYDYFEPEETKIIWKNIREHPEIKDISCQIWGELETLNEFYEGWSIF